MSGVLVSSGKINFWVASDGLLKGAALNALQIIQYWDDELTSCSQESSCQDLQVTC